MARTWNDALAIGIPLLDCQHQQLLDQMDALLEAIEQQKGQQELRSIMGFLKMYINNHFNYEESCMTLYKCPVACNNQNAHARFMQTLDDINRQIENKQPLNLISLRVKQELVDWFVNHIKSVDIKLKPCISVTKKEKAVI